MSDMDRFTRFLLRVGAAYHAPPETPREAMWASIERALEAGAHEDAGDPLIAAAAAYHEPPAAPVEDMWARIEAAWALRSGAPEGAREAGLDELPAAPWSAPAETARPTGRARITRWATAVTVAASLVIGIAIGRSSVGDAGTAGPGMAAGDSSPDAPAAGTTTVADPGAEGPTPDDAGAEPLESRLRLASIDPEGREPAGSGETGPGGARPATTPSRPSSRDVAMRYATAQHMGRAETLLTVFQAGLEEDDDSAALASWAKRLLGETRLLLDSSDPRSARQRALLEELELVLAQIAGLSPQAPEFERDMISHGIERQGTIARLRAASPGAATGQSTGT